MDPRYTRILIVLGSVIAALLLVVVIVMVTGGDSSNGTAESTSTTEGTTTTEGVTTTDGGATTSTEGATTTMAPTTTTSPPPECTGLPSATTPDLGSPGVTHVSGDFDGDGSLDQFIMYEALGTFWVQIRLSYGYAAELEVFGPTEAIGATTLGAPEELAYGRVTSGASTEFIGYFYFAECDIQQPTIDGVGVAEFARGGGVTHFDAIECLPDGIATHSSTTTDLTGSNWEYTERRYLWVPEMGDLQTVSSSTQMLTSPADDDIIFQASLDCPEG